MPRVARKKRERGIYHVMLRGINRQAKASSRLTERIFKKFYVFSEILYENIVLARYSSEDAKSHCILVLTTPRGVVAHARVLQLPCTMALEASGYSSEV